MPSMMRRCGAFGCPVQGFSGGRCGSRRPHCASVKSPRLTYPKRELRPETSALCRHALGRNQLGLWCDGAGEAEPGDLPGEVLGLLLGGALVEVVGPEIL